jgi:hypothetical protein
MSGNAVLENVRRYRTIASLYRQTAAFRPAQRWTLLAQAYEYERLAMFGPWCGGEGPEVRGFHILADGLSLVALAQRLGQSKAERDDRDQQGDLLVFFRGMMQMLGMLHAFLRAHVAKPPPNDRRPNPGPHPPTKYFQVVVSKSGPGQAGASRFERGLVDLEQNIDLARVALAGSLL